MSYSPSVRDVVESIATGRVGTVVEVNPHWGWFRVDYPPGVTPNRCSSTVKIYNMHDDSLAVRPIETAETRADYRLRQENNGLTSSWRD